MMNLKNMVIFRQVQFSDFFCWFSTKSWQTSVIENVISTTRGHQIEQTGGVLVLADSNLSTHGCFKTINQHNDMDLEGSMKILVFYFSQDFFSLEPKKYLRVIQFSKSWTVWRCSDI